MDYNYEYNYQTSSNNAGLGNQQGGSYSYQTGGANIQSQQSFGGQQSYGATQSYGNAGGQGVSGGNVISGGSYKENVVSSGGQGVSGGNVISGGGYRENVISSGAQNYSTGNLVSSGSRVVQDAGIRGSGATYGSSVRQGGVSGYGGTTEVVRRSGQNVVGGGSYYAGEKNVRSSNVDVVRSSGSNVIYGDKVGRNTAVDYGRTANVRTGETVRKSYGGGDGYLRPADAGYRGGSNTYTTTGGSGYGEVRRSKRSVRRSHTETRGEGRIVDTKTREGEPRVVETHELDRRELEVIERESVVKSRTRGEAYKTSERTTDSHVVREYEVPGEFRELRPSVQRKLRDKVVDVNIEKPTFTEKVVEVEVQVVKEKPVPIYKEVEVPYDVIVEKPIEKVIEKEVVTEILMEIPYEKVIEIPYERVVEIPIEKIIEKPVYIEDIVEIPVERVVEEVVEEIVERPIYNDRVVEIDSRDINRYRDGQILPTRYIDSTQEVVVENKIQVDRVIEKVVEVPQERIVENYVDVVREVQVERFVDKPVYRDNIIEKVIEVPVDVVVERQVERVIDKPVYRDNVIQVPVPREVVVEQIVEIPVENWIDRPNYVEQVRQVPVERIVEVAVDQVVEVPVYVDKIVEVPVYVDNIIQQQVEYVTEVPVPVERVVQKPVDVVREQVIENPVEVVREVPVEKIVQVPREQIVQVPVYMDNIIEHEVVYENVVQVPVENVVERPVYVNKVVEKVVNIENTVQVPVDVVRENVIERPVERIVEVPVEVEVERPIQIAKFVEKEVVIENLIEKPVERLVEIEEEVDINLKVSLEHHASKISMLSVENDQLEQEVNRLYNLLQNQGKLRDWDKDVHDLRIEVASLEQQLSQKLEHDRVKEKITTITYVENPQTQQMKLQKDQLAAEVSALSQKIQFQESRMALGTQNYESVVTSQLDNKGQVVGVRRSLRKSNRSKQAANIHNSSQINASYQGANSLLVPQGGFAQTVGISGLTSGGQGYSTSQVVSGGVIQQNIVGGNGQGLPPSQGRGYTSQVSGGGVYQQTMGSGNQSSGNINSMNYSQSMNQGGNILSSYEESQFYR